MEVVLKTTSDPKKSQALSEAKNLHFPVFKELLQILRSAQSL